MFELLEGALAGIGCLLAVVAVMSMTGELKFSLLRLLPN